MTSRAIAIASSTVSPKVAQPGRVGTVDGVPAFRLLSEEDMVVQASHRSAPLLVMVHYLMIKGIRAVSHSATVRFWIDKKAYEESKQAGCMAKNQRADVKNPNNASYKAAVDNRANQLNPNNTVTKSGRCKK